MPRLPPGCFVIGQPPGHATDMMPKPKCTMIFKLMFELNRTSGCKLRFETRCELFDSKCELTCKSNPSQPKPLRAAPCRAELLQATSDNFKTPQTAPSYSQLPQGVPSHSARSEPLQAVPSRPKPVPAAPGRAARAVTINTMFSTKYGPNISTVSAMFLNRVRDGTDL